MKFVIGVKDRNGTGMTELFYFTEESAAQKAWHSLATALEDLSDAELTMQQPHKQKRL